MKTVLVTQRVTEHAGFDESWDSLDVRWAELLASCGVLAVPMPSRVDPRHVLDTLRVDGVVLTGGRTRAVADGRLGSSDPDGEAVLAKLAIDSGVPLLAVGRGMLGLAAMLGVRPTAMDGHVGSHGLRVEAGTPFAAALAGVDRVNSYHHHCLYDAPAAGDGDEYRVVARADDGTVEAFAHRDGRVLAIAWQPERAAPFCSVDQELIRSLFGTRVDATSSAVP